MGVRAVRAVRGQGRARLYIGRCQAGALLIGREGRGAGAGPSYLGRPGTAPIYIKPAARARPGRSAPTPPLSSTAGARACCAAARGRRAAPASLRAGRRRREQHLGGSGADSGPGSGAVRAGAGAALRAGRAVSAREVPGAQRAAPGGLKGPRRGRGGRRCRWRRDPLTPTPGALRTPAPLLSRAPGSRRRLAFPRQGRQALRSHRRLSTHLLPAAGPEVRRGHGGTGSGECESLTLAPHSKRESPRAGRRRTALAGPLPPSCCPLPAGTTRAVRAAPRGGGPRSSNAPLPS